MACEMKSKNTPVPKAAKLKTIGFPRSLCPINMVLQMVGDSWSLLILRDMMFKGYRSYKDFHKAGEGIATNILADRLIKLENHGLLTKSPDPSDARRFIYGLTAKGAQLAPLLVEMIVYGEQNTPLIDTPKDIIDAIKRNKTAFAQNLIKAHGPKPKRKPVSIRHEDMEETLSLFD